MSKGHFTSPGASMEYGDATVLFPVEELAATYYQYRDAELALADVDGSDVIAVIPTSMATGYALGQRPLTVIEVDSLSPDIQGQLDDRVDVPIDTFELIQIGRWTADSPNHSLAEFGDS